MSFSGLHFDTVLVFFVYGLAFFTMGIALLLEASRSSLLAGRRVVWPLAIFGLLHGVHEWMEIFLLQVVWFGQPLPLEVSWFRVLWLVISFVPLVIFGLLILAEPYDRWSLFYLAGVGLIVLYTVLLAYNAWASLPQLVERADVLARYILAIPGGLLAGLALRVWAGQVQAESRKTLANCLRWAALGFFLYGLTQAFVSPVEMFPARYINNQVFLAWLGIPIQAVRAAMAILVTVNLLRAIHVVERERAAELMAAQQARLEALEQVQQDLAEREALRRELLRHTVLAQEDERKRIARELHDETAQFLTALSLNLATLRNTVPETRASVDLIDRLQSLSREMSRGIYRMVRALRPAQLDDLGLAAALHYLAEEERSRAGLEVSVQIKGTRQRLDPLVETVLFRVAQEALTNVARHAGCDRAAVRLQFAPQQVSLSVEDEGKGFRLETENPRRRAWGLAGMRERAESVGGKLNLRSAPGQGTVVEIVVPVAETDCEEPDHERHPINVG